MTVRPLKQKTIGILGGASDIATAEYYRFLNQAVNDELGGWEIAETVIVGVNFGNIESFLRKDDWTSLEAYLDGKVQQLIAADADVLLCVSNTLHKPFLSIVQKHSAPFIHIVDSTAEAIKTQGIKRVGLFGTRPTMELDYLKTRYLDKFDIEAISPNPEEQDEIDRIIFDELVKNNIKQTSKERYLEIAHRMVREEGIEGLILGCTEIFLLIDQHDDPDLPMFNTAKLHCDAAVRFALSSEPELLSII